MSNEVRPVNCKPGDIAAAAAVVTVTTTTITCHICKLSDLLVVHVERMVERRCGMIKVCDGGVGREIC
jgi:hypothetical protein